MPLKSSQLYICDIYSLIKGNGTMGRSWNLPMIHTMDCNYPSQLIQARILSQHGGELDLFLGGGGEGGGCSCLWSRTITPPSLFPIHHTMIGNCLLKSISDGDVAATANWEANFLPPWKMLQDSNLQNLWNYTWFQSNSYYDLGVNLPILVKWDTM